MKGVSHVSYEPVTCKRRLRAIPYLSVRAKIAPCEETRCIEGSLASWKANFARARVVRSLYCIPEKNKKLLVL